MKVSKLMEQTIKQLTEKHGIDLTAPEAYLHLSLASYMPLAVYNLGLSKVSVMHINRGRMTDPEIIFWTDDAAGWVAIEVTQTIGGHRVYGELDDTNTALHVLDDKLQASLTSFAEIWAQNIIDQGWFAGAEKTQERFPLGRIVATPGALLALSQTGLSIWKFLDQHARGDWGELEEFDLRQNENALEAGGRLLSRYVLPNSSTLYLITEWDRSVTTLLLPAEY